MAEQTLLGRWDLVVGTGADAFPSWVELGNGEGRFVGKVGSARPIKSIAIDGDTVRFSLPRQYEARTTDLQFEGKLAGGVLKGTCLADDGSTLVWEGKPAPTFADRTTAEWGEPINVIGNDLSGWVAREGQGGNEWSVINGELVNGAVGADLITKAKFKDFKLVAEYVYPPKSNSGIYLRGRYEFQILDDFGGDPHVGSSGAIYGFLKPSVNAVKPAGEVQTAEITLIGRQVKVVLNGQTVVEGEIPGITGGALDSDEASEGPLFVQGDHGPVTFKKLILYPAK